MKNNYKYCIGVMSGTSLDGLDIAYIKFNENHYIDFEILAAETLSYSSKWKSDLQNAISFSEEKLNMLDISYGKYLGTEINKFIKKNEINKVDFIASHGHTVLHQPEKGITLQIGSGKEIANSTAKKVVCDFRTQDVKLGGQGAPLVPIGDELLFSNYDYCINLGGFANISFKQDKKRIAFDVCPVNIVMNHYTRKIGLEYDDAGKLASEGRVNQELFSSLNSLEFYHQNPPKSLGLEWVQEKIFPVIEEFTLEIKDILRTFVEHVAFQISKIITSKASILITGGGAFNTFLLQRMEFFINQKIEGFKSELIDFKEALIFGFLGLLRLKNENNCLKSVTGAQKDHSSGVIFLPE